jgi:hypothetical protein
MLGFYLIGWSESMKTSLTGYASLAIFSGALAACGGGGGESAVVDPKLK